MRVSEESLLCSDEGEEFTLSEQAAFFVAALYGLMRMKGSRMMIYT